MTGMDEAATDSLRAAIEALPVHSISGYEWECYEQDSGCHYHWSSRDCPYGHPVTTEGSFDRDGVQCEHQALLDRDRVLALLATSRGDRG